jgi:hypothetical protein
MSLASYPIFQLNVFPADDGATKDSPTGRTAIGRFVYYLILKPFNVFQSRRIFFVVVILNIGILHLFPIPLHPPQNK